MTTQRLRAWHVSAQQLADATNGGGGGLDGVSTAGSRAMYSGHFSYADAPLKLGELSGNRFDIVLREARMRDVDVEAEATTADAGGAAAASAAQMARAVDAWAKCGFVNYFGLQRFGTGAVPTHAIGLAMLQRNWK